MQTHYLSRWVSTSGATGPWSETASATVVALRAAPLSASSWALQAVSAPRQTEEPLLSYVTSRRRRLTRVVFVAALVALVATSALFVVNRFRWFIVSHTTATEFRSVTVSNGAVWYGWALVPTDPSNAGWNATAAKRMGPQDHSFDPLRWWPVLRSKPRNFVLSIPLWMIALPSGAIAAWMLLISRRRPGQCECGYKLAGLPAQAPCPECGRARIDVK